MSRKEHHGAGTSSFQDEGSASNVTARLSDAVSTAAAIAASSTVVPIVTTNPSSSQSMAAISKTTTNTATALMKQSAMGSIRSHPTHLPNNVPSTAHASILPAPVQQSISSDDPSKPNDKLRKGKWTREEELYADCLIVEFERGALDDCENGTTLRMYLSRKLHCAPMRVSKKYAGQGIGKHVFMAERKHMASPAERLRRNELESAFYKSLLQQVEMTSGYPISLSGSIFAGVNSSAVNRTMMYTQPIQLAPGTLIPMVPPTSNVQVVPSMLRQPSVLPALSRPHAKSAVPNPSSQMPSSDPFGELQQTYRSALDQMKVNYSNSLPTRRSSGNDGLTNSNLALTGSQPPATGHAPISLKPATTMAGTLAHGAPAGAPLASASIEIPDFLSGFEKVAAASSSKAAPMAGSDQQRPSIPPLVGLFGGHAPTQPTSPCLADAECTPTFTSRSFDDFHRLLGNDCSPGGGHFDLNATSQDASAKSARKPEIQSLVAGALPSMPAMQGVPVSANHRNDADYYAMFAQESARAVSQHSAYHRQPGARAVSGLPEMLGTPLLAPKPLIAPKPSSTPPSSAMNAANLNVIDKELGLVKSRASDSSSDGTNETSPVSSLVLNTMSQPYPSQSANVVSGSERSSEVASEENDSAQSSSRGSGSDSSNSTADNASDNLSNDSDSASEEGPSRKKARTLGQFDEEELVLGTTTLTDHRLLEDQ